MDIDYKIQKYTHKLRNTSSQSRAKVYQQKLQEYHRLNKRKMVGGDEGEVKESLSPEEIINEINKDLGTFKTKSEEKCRSEQKVIEETFKNVIEGMRKQLEDKDMKPKSVNSPDVDSIRENIKNIGDCQATDTFTETLKSFNNFVKELAGKHFQE
jgi:hypothetical protein